MQEVISLDCFNDKGEFLGKKNFYVKTNEKSMNQWIKEYDKEITEIAFMGNPAPDFQHNSQLYISQNKGIEHFRFFKIHANNLIVALIYFAVRHAIPATWINDRDQFLYPNDEWQKDAEFQNDCLAFTLFHGQNRITRSEGINHFIPFSEVEVGAKESFESHFINDFIKGKLSKNFMHSKSQKVKEQSFSDESFYIKSLIPTKPLNFSDEALAVFEAGKALWKHYHSREFNDNKKPYKMPLCMI